MKKSLGPILLVAGITALSGCANNNADIARNNIRTTDVRDQVRNNVDVRDNNKLTVSERAVRNVESLPEVDRAHVIMRGNNAYVAVRLSDRAERAGTLGAGNNENSITGSNHGNIGNAGINNNVGTNGITGTGGSNPGGGTLAGSGAGGNTGMNGVTGTGNRGNTGNSGMTGTGAGGNTGNLGITGTGTGGNSGTGTAVPNDTTGMTDTRRNNNGAYSRVDTALEKRIEDQVRKANRNVNKVYVSTDTNFYNQMTTYSNDILNGRNRDGLFRNFTDTMNGFFNTR